MNQLAPQVVSAWRPEDPDFWASHGRMLANRTLWITTGALTLSFATWFMWSAIVVKLPGLGFALSDGQLFWLTALPGLVGATLRIPYSFIIQMFGTRAVVTLATASLLVPAFGVGWAVQHPDTPFGILALLAMAAGFGGGNFSAFMSSTSLFFPKKRQGFALGVQAGIGNFGVSLVQFLTPMVIGVALFGSLGGDARTFTKGQIHQQLWIQNAAYLWAAPVVFFTIAAALGLRSLPVKASLKQQAVIFRRKHNWIMTSLYIMTFGTFSGFSASFALLIKKVFGEFPDAPDPLKYAFLGALIGSSTRILAGWLSDKVGGARMTMVAGVMLVVGALGLAAFAQPQSAADFLPFLLFVLLIFLGAGVGNGSTFRMIPVIFPPTEAAPVLGWTAAVGAYGAFLVPMLFNWSFGSTGTAVAALRVLAVFYVLNLVLCWWYYARRRAEVKC